MSRVNKIKLYARALAEILAKSDFAKSSTAEEGKIIKNFVKVLVSAGLEKKANEILELAEEMLLAKQGKKKIVFETARKITTNQKKMLEGIAKKGDLIKEKINPELIAGVKIIINNNRQFDSSLKNKLQKIF